MLPRRIIREKRDAPRRRNPYLDLDLVPLLHLLHLSVLVPELGLLVLKVLPGDFPERIDLVLLLQKVARSSSSSSQDGNPEEEREEPRGTERLSSGQQAVCSLLPLS